MIGLKQASSRICQTGFKPISQIIRLKLVSVLNLPKKPEYTACMVSTSEYRRIL